MHTKTVSLFQILLLNRDLFEALRLNREYLVFFARGAGRSDGTRVGDAHCAIHLDLLETSLNVVVSVVTCQHGLVHWWETRLVDIILGLFHGLLAEEREPSNLLVILDKLHLLAVVNVLEVN